MNYRYPTSFPNETERRFFSVLFADDATFATAVDQWITTEDFNTTPIAITRLLPTLYRRIHEAHYHPPNTTAHDTVLNKIKGIYKLAWYKNQSLLKDMREILTLFNSATIPVVLLKGSALLAKSLCVASATHHEALGARFQNDIDLLIHPHHVRTAITLFKNSGWHLTDPQFTIIEQYPDSKLFTITKEVTFSKPGSVDIDIHWRIIDSDKSNTFTNAVWTASHLELFSGALTGTQALLPADEDLLLHTVIHGAHRNDVRAIRWVSDTITLIKQGVINWKRLTENVHTFGYDAEVYFAFRYLNEFHAQWFPPEARTLLSQLRPTPGSVRRYFSQTDTVIVPFFGNAAKLWRGYRTTNHSYSLPEYFAHHWNLGSPREIPKFILRKLFGRILNLLHRLGIFLSITRKNST